MIALAVTLAGCHSKPTDPPSDTTRPTVLSVSPAEGAVDVPVDARIRVVFSEAIAITTFSASTFAVNPVISGSFGFSGDTVTVNPDPALDYSTTYVVSLTTGITDLAGNRLAANKSWSFTTADNPATTPPQVIATSPSANSTDIDPTTSITATFSKTIDPTTVTTASFTVDGVTGTVSLSDSTAVFVPNDTLAFNTLHTARLDTTVTDTFGNHLTAPYTWNFTTGDDPLIPTASIWSPVDSVIIDDTVTVLVSAYQPVAVTNVEFYLDGAHVVGADDNTAPYEFFWDASAETLGSQHTIYAIAYEAGGRVGYSDTISLFCRWQPLITDRNDPSWPTDIRRILARSTDTQLEFRYEFSEAWGPDPVNDTTLDLGIYLDTDRSSLTGRTDFDGQNLNGIGAEYRIIIGLHGLEALARWDPAGGGTGQWIVLYDPNGFTYLNLPPDTNVLEFGLPWSDLGTPSAMNMVSINLWFLSPESYLADWVPDQDSGYITVRRQDRYIGEGYTQTAPRVRSSDRAAANYDNPF